MSVNRSRARRAQKALQGVKRVECGLCFGAIERLKKHLPHIQKTKVQGGQTPDGVLISTTKV